MHSIIMVVKLQSVDDIVSKFPIKTLPKLDGEPTYESINSLIQIKLTENVSTLTAQSAHALKTVSTLTGAPTPKPKSNVQMK